MRNLMQGNNITLWPVVWPALLGLPAATLSIYMVAYGLALLDVRYVAFGIVLQVAEFACFTLAKTVGPGWGRVKFLLSGTALFGVTLIFMLIGQYSLVDEAGVPAKANVNLIASIRHNMSDNRKTIDAYRASGEQQGASKFHHIQLRGLATLAKAKALTDVNATLADRVAMLEQAQTVTLQDYLTAAASAIGADPGWLKIIFLMTLTLSVDGVGILFLAEAAGQFQRQKRDSLTFQNNINQGHGPQIIGQNINSLGRIIAPVDSPTTDIDSRPAPPPDLVPERTNNDHSGSWPVPERTNNDHSGSWPEPVPVQPPVAAGNLVDFEMLKFKRDIFSVLPEELRIIAENILADAEGKGYVKITRVTVKRRYVTVSDRLCRDIAEAVNRVRDRGRNVEPS